MLFTLKVSINKCFPETGTTDRAIRNNVILEPTNQPSIEEYCDIFNKFSDGSITFVNRHINNPESDLEQSTDFEYIDDEESLKFGITSIFSKLELKQ